MRGSIVRNYAWLVFFCIALSPCTGMAASNWDHSIELYGLAANIEGDVSVGRAVGNKVDVDTSDILEALQLAGMFHAEAHHPGGWGIILDYAFMDLGADTLSPLGGIVDAGIRQGMLELFGARRFGLSKGYYEVYGGIRWWDNDVDLVINPAVLPGSATASVEIDWVDPVIGITFVRPFSENWEYMLRGDIGGFGIESDFSTLLSAGLHYRFNKTVSLDVFYKALWVDYEEGTVGAPGYFAYDTVTHGPGIGVIFEF